MSVLGKKWRVRPRAPKRFHEQFPEQLPLVRQLLWNRGLRAQQDIDSFFNPDYDRDVHSPDSLRGMKRAVNRINAAIESGERVVIFGDYDADGVCGAALLKEAFEAFGASVSSVYIPHREEEGYGLNKQAIEGFAQQGATLLITVDCGSTNVDEVRYARTRGIDVVVTDHHQVLAPRPPAVAFVNPHQKNDRYPFKDLAGTAVAFKVVQALLRYRRAHNLSAPPEGWEKWLLDLVALATITDVMPLHGENRALVKYGLFVLAQTRRPGLRELMRVANVEPTINHHARTTNLNPFTLGFVLGPRINAAGRMQHADVAFQLITATSTQRARALARTLDEHNKQRQRVVRTIINEIEKKDLATEEAIVEGNEAWSIGVLGIVAGRLADRYHKPTFLYQRKKAELVGSARTPGAFHTVELLEAASGSLLRFGGHAQAGGFTARLTSEDAFRAGIMRAVHEHAQRLPREARAPALFIDAHVTEEDINWRLYDELAKLEPFGEGNEQPVFLLRGAGITNIRTVGKAEAHLRCDILFTNARPKKAIGFRLAPHATALKNGDTVDIVFRLAVDEWNGSRELSLELLDVSAKPSA